MRKSSPIFSLILSIFCLIGGGDASERHDPTISAMITSEEGVFLKIDNNWIAAEALQATGEGILVLVESDWITVAEALENPDCARRTWTCDRCGYVNYDGIEACGVCGKSRPRRR